MNLEFMFYVCRRIIVVCTFNEHLMNNIGVGIVVDLQQHGVHIVSQWFSP